MKTLPDAVRGGLRALAVGINPSLPSVRAGFYFANPRNRFWPALNASRLVDAPLPPGLHAIEVLVERYGIGFTDIVKRPTAGSAELHVREYREGAVRLEALVFRHEPAVVWFQGAQAWRVFVTPNPSPANASYSLPALVRWFDALAVFLPPVEDPVRRR